MGGKDMEKELTSQEEDIMPSTLDLLLGKNIAAVNKTLPTARWPCGQKSGPGRGKDVSI